MMPISCAGLPDIALSLPVKTLTLPAIDTAERTEQLSKIRAYGRGARLRPDRGRVDARAVRLLHLRVGSIPYTLGGMCMPPRLLRYRSKELNDGKRVDLSSGAGRGAGAA